MEENATLKLLPKMTLSRKMLILERHQQDLIRKRQLVKRMTIWCLQLKLDLMWQLFVVVIICLNTLPEANLVTQMPFVVNIPFNIKKAMVSIKICTISFFLTSLSMAITPLVAVI